jgi:hypothetical protein
MEDTQTPTITPEAPPVSTPEAPPTAPESGPRPEPAAPLTREQAKANLRTPLPSKEPAPATEPSEPKPDATGRLHGPNGKFVEKPGESPGEKSAETPSPESAEPTAEREAGPEAEGDSATTESEGAQTPEGFVRIELPQDHPLRDQGHEFMLAPEGQEDLYRNLANSPVKRRELEEARTQREQLENELIRHQAAVRAANEFNALLISNPQIIETHKAMRAEYGEEYADTWLSGLIQQQGQNVDRYVGEAQAAHTERQQRQEAQTFARTALETAARDVPAEIANVTNFQGHVQNALAMYATDLQLRHQRGESASFDYAAFRQEFLQPALMRDPQVRQVVERAAEQRRAAEAERTRQANAEKERAALEQARQKINENPLGAVNSAAHTGHVPAPESKPMSYAEAKNQALGRA